MILELLAPAKDLEHGIAAIDAGADAVYIGGPGFSARTAAHNSMDDIAALVRYAHRYGVRVFVAMNTVLFEDELSKAEQVARSLIELGVDALIVQDMAYATMGLDIALHASTQMSCDSVERAVFLAECGFSRIVLERGLSLDQIEAIGAAVKVDIEAFVHGAICVSTSGKCYMGEIVSSRSGNRGCCSQPCRSRFNLEDASGKVLLADKHLLSLKDLNLSAHLSQLAVAGVNSFKIEGRLKDMAYLRNSVAYYRKQIDALIDSSDSYVRASSGVSRVDFTPSPEVTFSRGFTTFNLLERSVSAASFDTGRSVGAYIGEVDSVGRDSFTLKGMAAELAAGDGVVLYSVSGHMAATNINGANGNRVTPNKMEGIIKGMKLYRNYDKKGVDKILSSKLIRQIDTKVEVCFKDSSLVLTAQDMTGCSCVVEHEIVPEAPSNMQRFIDNLQSQFAKSGGTMFCVTAVEVVGEPQFLPISQINSLRRELLEALESERLKQYVGESISSMVAVGAPQNIDYKYNVTNSKSLAFYQEAGAKHIDSGVELQDNYIGIDAMTTSYCIRRQMGECLKEGGRKGELYIKNGAHRFKLEFDCAKCQMRVVYKEKIK